MFFLGGFNTIIPHLIYLSLIWIFILIGLSGKMNFTQFDPPECSETSFHQASTQHLSMHVFPDLQDAEISGDIGNYYMKDQVFPAPSKPLSFPLKTYEVIDYRGPPQV